MVVVALAAEGADRVDTVAAVVVATVEGAAVIAVAVVEATVVEAAVAVEDAVGVPVADDVIKTMVVEDLEKTFSIIHRKTIFRAKKVPMAKSMPTARSRPPRSCR